MAVNNAIEIIISATDKASTALSKSENLLKWMADGMSDFAKRPVNTQVIWFREKTSPKFHWIPIA